jgi:starvation-inducible DNA-binding protein
MIVDSTEPRMFPTRVDLPAEARKPMIDLLNQQLADTIDLYSQLKQAHWNVKGPQFHQLHLLFDAVAEAVEGDVDMLAERATALGGSALGTVRLAAAASRLPEYDLEAVDGMQHILAVIERLQLAANSARAAIDRANSHADAGTADLFTEISRGLDKQLWLLEAHLKS